MQLLITRNIADLRVKSFFVNIENSRRRIEMARLVVCSSIDASIQRRHLWQKQPRFGLRHKGCVWKFNHACVRLSTPGIYTRLKLKIEHFVKLYTDCGGNWKLAQRGKNNQFRWESKFVIKTYEIWSIRRRIIFFFVFFITIIIKNLNNLKFMHCLYYIRAFPSRSFATL